MGELIGALEKFANGSSVDYSTYFVNRNGTRLEVGVLELSRASSDESVLIFDYGEKYRLAYVGDNPRQMQTTIGNLRLPSHPHQNDGEAKFYNFGCDLEKDVSVPLTSDGLNIEDLELVLCKLLYVWETDGPVDGEFSEKYECRYN